MSFFNLEVKIQSDQQIFFWAILELVKIVFLIEPLFLFGTLKRNLMSAYIEFPESEATLCRRT